MGRLSAIVGALAAVGLSVSGCSSAPSTTGEKPAPDAATSTPATTTPLEGDWVSRLSPREITRNLAAAGQERWADEFFAAESITEDLTAVYTFDGDFFRVAYLNPDGTWQVGWKGAVEVDGTTVDLYDDFSRITDTFSWRVDRQELRLDWTSSDAARLKGIPVEVFHDAYLSRPLVRTDCSFDVDVPC